MFDIILCTQDHVFGGDFGHLPGQLYPKCVAPLVDGLFKGYNATIFAYGPFPGLRVLCFKNNPKPAQNIS